MAAETNPSLSSGMITPEGVRILNGQLYEFYVEDGLERCRITNLDETDSRSKHTHGPALAFESPHDGVLEALGYPFPLTDAEKRQFGYTNSETGSR